MVSGLCFCFQCTPSFLMSIFDRHATTYLHIDHLNLSHLNLHTTPKPFLFEPVLDRQTVTLTFFSTGLRLMHRMSKLVLLIFQKPSARRLQNARWDRRSQLSILIVTGRTYEALPDQIKRCASTMVKDIRASNIEVFLTLAVASQFKAFHANGTRKSIWKPSSHPALASTSLFVET